MDLLEMYRRENKKVCWDTNTQQRIISLLVNPEDPKSCSDRPCDLQRFDVKKVPSSNSDVFPCPAAPELFEKEVGVLLYQGMDQLFIFSHFAILILSSK